MPAFILLQYTVAHTVVCGKFIEACQYIPFQGRISDSKPDQVKGSGMKDGDWTNEQISTRARESAEYESYLQLPVNT